jgi:hypothetical protein
MNDTSVRLLLYEEDLIFFIKITVGQSTINGAIIAPTTELRKQMLPLSLKLVNLLLNKFLKVTNSPDKEFRNIMTDNLMRMVLFIIFWLVSVLI